MPGLGDLLGNFNARPRVQQPGQAFVDPMQNMGFTDRLAYLKENNPQALMSLAAGMMKGDMGAGYASAGDAMAQHRQELMGQQEKQMDLQQAQLKENQTKRWLMANKGMSEEEATMAMSNPAILGTYLKADEQYADNRPAAVQEYEYAQSNPGYAEWAAANKGRESNLTATDKKAILEADEMVSTAEGALPILDEALKLSPKAYDGATAGIRGWATSQVGNEAGTATVEYDNLVKQQALSQLKAIFGAAPTEGERKILMEIAGSSSLPAKVREGVLTRAKVAVQRRLNLYKERADGLRGGTFYKGAPQQAPSSGGWTIEEVR